MAAPTSTNEVTARKLSSSISALWTKIKSTFQPVADRVTSIRAASSATNTKYPTEKAVAVELEKMIPFGYAIFDTNPFGGKHLYINSISDAMFSMDKRYYVTATTHKIVDNGVEYPRIKEGAVETDDVYYEDSPVLGTLTDSQIRSFFNGHYDSGFAIGDGKYLKIHIQFSNEENWSPSTGGYFPGYPYGDYFLSFYYSRVPESAQWRCYNRYTTNQQTAGWKKGNFGYFEGNASSVASVILKGTDNSNYQRSCIEIIVFARDGVNTMLTQIDWRLSGPTLADHFPFFTNFATQKSYVNWEFRQKVSSSPVIKLDVDNEKIVANNLELTNALHVSYGGTGKSSVTSGNYLVGNGTSAMVEKTPKEVGSNVLSSLDTDNGNVVDDDYIVGSYHVNDTTISSTQFVRRTAVKLWNYIKSKLSGSDVNIGGNAATAGTADTAKAYDTSFSGTNSIASALNGKSPTTHTHKTDAADVTSDDTNLGDAEDTMQFVTTDAAGYDSSHKPLYRRPALKIWNWIKSKLASDTGYINFAHSVDSATNVNSHVLAGVVFADNSLHSCMFTFVMAVTFNFRESDECGGILKVDVGIDMNGGFYVKNISLSNVTGALSVGDFNLVVGEVLNRKVVGVTWNGVLKGSRYLRGTILSRYVAGDDTEFVYNNDVANGATQAWSSARQWADDSAVVHIAGSETITGAKEFSRSGQDTNFTDSSGAESIVRARTATNSNNGSCQLDAYASGGKYGLYARNSGGAGKWVANLDNDGVVNLGSSGDAVRIGGTKFVFGASQLGTDSNTFYWV